MMAEVFSVGDASRDKEEATCIVSVCSKEIKERESRSVLWRTTREREIKTFDIK